MSTGQIRLMSWLSCNHIDSNLIVLDARIKLNPFKNYKIKLNSKKLNDQKNKLEEKN